MVVVGGLVHTVAAALRTQATTVTMITLDDAEPARMKAHLESIAAATSSGRARPEADG